MVVMIETDEPGTDADPLDGRERVMTGFRAMVVAEALGGPEAARRVIKQHLRSDAGGRCLACGELEPCRQRDIAHAVLFGNDRRLPRRRPMELIGTRGDFGNADGQPFDAFGAASCPRAAGSAVWRCDQRLR